MKAHSFFGAITIVALCSFLAVSARAATPPVLKFHGTTLNVGDITSGAAARSSGHLIFAGGHIGNTTAVSDVVHVIDLKTNTVGTLTPLPTARAGLGLVEQIVAGGVSENHLFAIGGVNASGVVLSTVEIYNFGTNSWSTGAAMPTARGFLSVVAGTDGKIYAIGGTNSSGHPVATVEAYDPVANTWSTVAALNTARSHCAAVLGPQDVIYVAGGIDPKGNYLNSVEGYFLASPGAWEVFPSMNVARADFGFCEAADTFLYVEGGKNSTGTLNSIEGFNGAWTLQTKTLKQPQAEIAAVEGLTGGDFLLGGANGSKLLPNVRSGITPAQPAHTITFYLHDVDEPFINGSRTMDQQFPLTIDGLSINLLNSPTWASFPALSGTLGSGGSVTVNNLPLLGLALLTTFTLSATDLDGGSVQQLGQTSVLLGLDTSATIPVSTPLTLKNKVLVLTIATTVGLDLDLALQRLNLVVTNFTGTP